MADEVRELVFKCQKTDSKIDDGSFVVKTHELTIMWNNVETEVWLGEVYVEEALDNLRRHFQWYNLK